MNTYIGNYMRDNKLSKIPVGTYIVTPSFTLLEKGILEIFYAVGPDCRIPDQKNDFEKTLYDLYSSTIEF